MTASRPADHFERLYRNNPDPWDFESSTYEQAKYRQTVATLGERHFVAGLEVGCSIGVLTRMLAARCDRLLGIDLVEAPLRAARARCAQLGHVAFQQMRVPEAWPAGSFDLIMFSEVLYFLTPEDIDLCAARVLTCVLPCPVVVLVNWTGQTDDPTSGDDAADRFIAAVRGRLMPMQQQRHHGYRLDVLEPT